MARRRLPSLATPLVLLLLATGCAGSPPSPAETAPQPAARYPSTEADARFMADMISHHAQAIVMAGWVPSHGSSPAVRRLAERIASGQQDEIAIMQQWLRERARPVPEGGHMGHGHLMPGMLTAAQMDELAAAKGTAFDRLFLTYMIQHHRGAVAMVKELFGTQGAAQDQTVFKFANDVNVDQTTEIARMERELAALPPAEPST